MTDYTKTTDFTSKDSLPSGDSGKIIRGAEFGTEFDNIETAVNSKSNINNPSFTGNITVTGTVDGRDIAADGTKLDTIETSADVTDTANVTAAGAVMDSELTDITAVKALNQGVATTDSPTFAAVTSTGNVTVGGTVDGRDVAADGTKLDTVETNADVTDTTNVTAAGALMDSEVTNLDQVKAFDSSDYATAAQGTTADNALPKTGGAMTGAITTNSTFDGRDVATDGTKLDGIEASADVTDTANVTAAGALMDSELTSEASVKALNQGVATTDSPTFAGVTANGTVEFDGLSGTGAVTVTDILDQDDMSGNSATALATQQSIKAYVDSQVATSDTLAEVLANGNATGGTDVAFGDNDKATFGASDDLEIYHDGTASYIADVGAGDLILQAGNDLILRQPDGSTEYLRANEGAGVQIYHNGSQKFLTTATGIDVTGVITTDGMTTSADINFGDNDKAIFGTGGSDLQIYHDGSNSYIVENGVGDLTLQTNGPSLNLKINAGENALTTQNNGGVTVYYDNSAKLATTSTGIDVTGTATMDNAHVPSSGSYEVGGTASGTTAIGSLSNSAGKLTLDTDSTRSIHFKTGGNLRQFIDGTTGDISFYEDTGTTASLVYTAASTSLKLTGREASRSNNTYALEVDNSAQGSNMSASGAFNVKGYYGNQLTVNGLGDVSFYDDSGTAKLFWDASAERLGLGIGSPARQLHIQSNGPDAYLKLNSTGNNSSALLELANDATTWTAGVNSTDTFVINNGANERMRIDSSGNVNIYGTDNRPLAITSFATASAGAGWDLDATSGNGVVTVSTGGDEAFRVDSSQNLLVGTTDLTLYDETNGGETGFALRPDGRLYNSTQGNTSAIFNRIGTGGTEQGAILQFRSNGSTVGSIGSGVGDSSASTLYIADAGNVGIRFDQASTDDIQPCTSTGADRDNAINLGASDNRFKDLYLSGNVTHGVTPSSSAAGVFTEAAGRTTYSRGSGVGGFGHLSFINGNGAVGSVVTSGTATAYNTSSDYRLKENVVSLTSATERLKQLEPKRFNFIADADVTVDGFLAHEVADVVPEAITGAKDAMRDEEYEVTPAVLGDDGNVVTEAVMGTRSVPDYQGIDQSKLVPLLVATIQELEARITHLETN